MDTNVLSPLQVFTLPQHLMVPLFQRPYVWNEVDQWQPLWDDVRRMAELRLRDPYSSATHFLGAVVVQAQENALGNVQARNIIDGQQRLTTLQLLMDAAAAVFEESGLDGLAAQMESLTHNAGIFVADEQERLKIRHTNKDRGAFQEVMNADPPVDHASLKFANTLVARAHEFFVLAVAGWLEEAAEGHRPSRANALADVLTRGLQIVVIDLQVNENSQEIFETLNARGTPLTAADLVKNLVFQRLDAEGADTKRVYAEDWPFDQKFWEAEVSVGRYPMSRSSLFLNQWLGSRVGEEVSPKATFTRFKHFVEHESNQKMHELLQVIKRQADLYEQWTIAAEQPDRELTPVEMAVYRMHATKIELLKPILIWLHEPTYDLPEPVVNSVVGTVESWVMRRQLLRLPSGNLGRVVTEIIAVNRGVPAEELPTRVAEHLMRLSAVTNYWPGDAEIRRVLRTESAYRRYNPKSRLRMFLEAIEDHLRSPYDVGRVSRRGYPIEHILPQKWETHWPVDGLEAEVVRRDHVHRFGNLTLLTEGLNSSVSNGPWLGPTGKWAKLEKYDVLLMNREIRRISQDGWNEDLIDQRTAAMVDALLAVWPVPEGHTGQVEDHVSVDNTWVELKHLIAAGLLEPGTRLTPRPGSWPPKEAVVLATGHLEIEGQAFDTPSGAGKHVKGGTSANGWAFWLLPDGRRLAELRAIYRGQKPSRNETGFDWSTAHVILSNIPAGRWTSYQDLADAVGTAPQPMGQHITSCSQCVNAHRVLTSDGRVAAAFRWADPTDRRDPQLMLIDEGLGIVDGRADPSARMTVDDLLLVPPAHQSAEGP